jgi:hypothetical protein
VLWVLPLKQERGRTPIVASCDRDAGHERDHDDVADGALTRK